MEMAPNLMKERIRVLPDFKKEFPGVFPDKEQEGLPPSRGECDYEIPIIPGIESEFKKRYVPVAEAWLPQMRQHLNKWQQAGIAVIGEGQFACPTFAHQQKNHMSSITSGSSSSNGSNGCFLNLRKQIVVDLVIPEANLF
jgi:hypothetical protein